VAILIETRRKNDPDSKWVPVFSTKTGELADIAMKSLSESSIKYEFRKKNTSGGFAVK